MTLTQKLIQNLSKNRNVQSFLSDFEKLSDDLKEKRKLLNQKWTSGKKKTVSQAYGQYQKVVKSISKAQLELDREVSKAISLIIKSADDVEKNLTAYKKMAIAKKAKVEKLIASKQAQFSRTSAKKAKSTKPRKAATPKASRRKTTRKK